MGTVEISRDLDCDPSSKTLLRAPQDSGPRHPCLQNEKIPAREWLEAYHMVRTLSVFAVGRLRDPSMTRSKKAKGKCWAGEH